MKERPKVGFGVYILRDGKVLLGKRIGKHGYGTWCPPGGHLEFNEELEDGARRETREECGVSIKNIRFAGVTNDMYRDEGKHYVVIHFIAEIESGEPRVMEPDKFAEWKWFKLGEYPSPLLLPCSKFLVDCAHKLKQ